MEMMAKPAAPRSTAAGSRRSACRLPSRRKAVAMLAACMPKKRQNVLCESRQPAQAQYWIHAQGHNRVQAELHKTNI